MTVLKLSVINSNHNITDFFLIGKAMITSMKKQQKKLIILIKKDIIMVHLNFNIFYLNTTKSYCCILLDMIKYL